MIVAVSLTVLGLLIGIALVQLYGLRLSGVLVVPLFAVYTLYDFLALPAFVLGVVASYGGLSILHRRTFLFGRQLLLSSMVISMTVPLVAFEGLSLVGVHGLTLTEFTFVGSILPGVAAYNYHQLEPERRKEDVLMSIAALTGLIGLGAGLVNRTVAVQAGRSTPPVLFGQESDIAVYQGATVGEPMTVLGASFPLVFVAILVGMVASEGTYLRWGIRLNGIIAVPLLAFFALQSMWILPLYVVGVAVVYGAISYVHRATLLYGRVLLALGLAISIAGSIPVAIALPVASGLHLYFTAVLIGIGAYNLHRMPPEHRRTSITLSAAAFVVFVGTLRTLVTPAGTGILVDPGFLEFGLAGLVVVAGAISVARLERLRPTDTDRRSASVHTRHT